MLAEWVPSYQGWFNGVNLKKIEWPGICEAFGKKKKTTSNMRATGEERQQVYYQSYKAYIIGRGLEIPFPLRYLLKDEYLIISTDKRISPYQSPAASPENLGRRELEKKVNENNYNYDKPNNYDNNYTEFSPADHGHFDHFNEEPNEESNEEPKQEPISPADRGHFDHFNEEPKEVSNEEPKQEPISPADRGHFDHFNEEPKQEPIKEPKVEPNEETVVEVGVEFGSGASEETVVEVVPEQGKGRRAKKRGIDCKSPYTVEFGRKKKNDSATGPLIMIPQDYTGFALESFVGKGEWLPMYYIRRDAIIEQYHRYSGRYRMDWVFWDVLMGHKAHVEVWIRLLQESRNNKADWSLMPYTYFENPVYITKWIKHFEDEPNAIHWWKVDRFSNDAKLSKFSCEWDHLNV
ncbi:hypothetical protein LXL04_016237 [Taraxacum kok-saghyz]